MKTIKIVLSTFALLAMVSFSNAQNTDKAAANKERTEKIIKHLELSEEQAVKARELANKYSTLFSNAKDDAERKKLNDEADAETKKILTEEQYKKYKAYVTAEKNPKQAPRTERIGNVPRTSN
jgi:DNA replication protein DnaC